MLLINKHRGGRIREVPISTVYIDGNQSSHFNPLIDSVKIYFTLLRFSLTSAATAVLDYAIFALALKYGAVLGVAQLIARTVALFFNYAAVRRVVFHSHRKHSVVFPRYVLLVIVSGLVSLGIMSLLVSQAHLSVLIAKLIAELAVFLANFAIQRDFIFGTPATDPNGVAGVQRNDWLGFLIRTPLSFAADTRRYTQKVLASLIFGTARRRQECQHLSRSAAAISPASTITCANRWPPQIFMPST